MYKLLIIDGTCKAEAIWFNQTYLKTQFKAGQQYKLYGKIKKVGTKITINSPVFDSIESERNTGKIIPIYPLTYNLTQNVLRKIMENGLKELEGNMEETLPKYLLEEYNLQDINMAIKNVHLPKDFSQMEKARYRLVFEELLSVQLALLELKNNYMSKIEGIEFSKEAHISDIVDKLPFRLTKAQLRVLEEIDNNMESKKPMNRLLQGDVRVG